MERRVIKTADGSSTIFIPELGEHYHSVHGAVMEAMHVYIGMGLHYFMEKEQKDVVRILEMGFGTGLNAFLSLLESQKFGWSAEYTALEAYPVTQGELDSLNYATEEEAEELFLRLHQVQWENEQDITGFFRLKKEKKAFIKIDHQDQFDVIFFDAFGPKVQPELWGEEIFSLMYMALKKGGVLVTYCAKGSVRRTMQEVGFSVSRLPGPPGKREMLRAEK